MLSGTFSECVDLGGLDIEIIGSGSANTTIDCAGGATWAVDGTNASFQLKGLTIANGSSQGVLVDGGTLVVLRAERFVSAVPDCRPGLNHPVSATYIESIHLSEE